MITSLLLGCASPDRPGHVGAGVASLVPLPAVVEWGDGAFELDSNARIVDATGEGDLLVAALRDRTGFALPQATVPLPGDLVLRLAPSLALPDEGYLLDVGPSGAFLQASDADGLFWATQTLLQLFPVSGDPIAPAVHVEDAPRFGWRGAMIDVARHFFDVGAIERQVDAMAQHKLNRLHLHLTDDQGWRLEIKSWPDLALIGGSTQVGGGPGGYYSQEEFAEIAAYAAARHVVVVPEIDLPGHANAALASYAELNEDGVAPRLSTSTGASGAALWVDGPDTDRFLADVLGEVAAITPGDHVHVGADEVSELSTAQYDDFVQLAASDLASAGKAPVGWDEVGGAGIPPPFVAQYWFDVDNALAAFDAGGEVIASPAAHCYLDMIYDTDATFGQVWAGAVDEHAAYQWDPEADLPVIGVEAPLWTELVDTRDKMDFMLWPRLAATAEVGWTPQAQRDWADFAERMPGDGERLDELGIGFYRTPEIAW